MTDLSINKDIKIEKYISKACHYIIEVPVLGHQVVVDEATYELIDLIKQKKTISVDNLHIEYTREYDPATTLEEIKEALTPLYRTGIVVSEQYTSKKRKNKYLKVKIILLPRVLVNFLSGLLTFLYHQWVIRFLVFSIPFVVFGIIYKVTQVELSTLKAANFFPLLLISILFHELGHATALKYCNENPYEIGFGLYLFIIPVFYTNLSAAWKLPAKKRILVDLGGLYFHYIFVIFIFFISLFAFPELIMLLLMLLTLMLYQLNPFIRMDGYWLISDLIKEDQLMKTSTELLEEYSIGLIKNQSRKFIVKEKLLLAYAIISKTYIFFIYLIVILSQPDLFINFIPNITDLFSSKIQFTFDYVLSTIITIGLPIGFLFGILFFIIINSLFIKKVYQLASKID
ncbi:hypothetical protein ABW636_07225 [Aquimarina sp. 2201CG1-2-11]|uniref:hypothetical protein n=1 Tax=Aquimarina discodermiae TaxID=3231043 RepID=UPI0034621E7D